MVVDVVVVVRVVVVVEVEVDVRYGGSEQHFAVHL